MTFLPAAGSYLVTSSGANDVLKLNAGGLALSNDSSFRQEFSGLTVQAGATQLWNAKANGFTFTQVSLGDSNTVSFSGTGTSLTTRTELVGSVTSFPGTPSGITKVGSGTLFLGPASSLAYSGATTISGGTLLLGGANKLPNAANLVLGGGTLDIAGFDETTGKLSLAGTSTISFGISNTADLVFDASSDQSWGAFTLNISGFTQGQDTLRFGTSSAGLTAPQLAGISFDGAQGAAIDANGFVSPVPEPSTALLLGVGALAMGGMRRRLASRA